MKMSHGWKAGVMAALAASFAMHAQAAPFDEKVATPRASTSQALQARLNAHFATFERKQQEADPAAFIRDSAAYRQWSDTYFAVKLALDEGTPLGDLSKFGLILNPEGTYQVNLRAFPQWEPLDSRLNMFSDPAILESYVPALEARGFRESDVNALRTYVATHDPRLTSQTEGKQLVDTFARRLQVQRRGARKLNLPEVLSYRYQKESLKAEARRKWALGLVDTLDRQRLRILVSLLDESDAQLTFGKRSGSFERELEEEARPILSGEYVQAIASQEAQLRRDLAQRTEKLREEKLKEGVRQ